MACCLVYNPNFSSARIHVLINKDTLAGEQWYRRLSALARSQPVPAAEPSQTGTAYSFDPQSANIGRDLISIQAGVEMLLARDTPLTEQTKGVAAVHVTLLDMGGQPEFWQPIGGLLRTNSTICVRRPEGSAAQHPPRRDQGRRQSHAGHRRAL